MLTRTQTPNPAVHARELLSLAINAALALGWNVAAAAPPQVTNCNSAGAGSLAAAIADPMTADGDVIDLAPLKTVCSKITLDNLAIQQNDLTLQGPGAKYLAIDGANNARVIRHEGTGTLALSSVTIANGNYTSDSKGKGGCLYSMGSVALIDVDISHCTVHGTSDPALGGGVYTRGNLHLLRSRITDSHAEGIGAYVAARGGGAYSKSNFTALYSTISGNVAETEDDAFPGQGGGIAAEGDVNIEYSTISANEADMVGGVFSKGGVANTTTIATSTVSGNTTKIFGGLAATTALVIHNSTIAFNRSLMGFAFQGAGLYSAGPIVLNSSIVTGNSGQDGPNDLAGSAAITVTGSDNLVFKSSLILPMNNNTTGVCTKLDVLADNGGPTLTHGLKSMSAAIDKGSASMSLSVDQRLEPRMTGPQVDIGAIEWNLADKLEGILVAGFDGLCDQ